MSQRSPWDFPEIEKSEIELENEFAVGSFGRLVKGVYRGERVAVKILNEFLCSCEDEGEGTKAFFKEVAMLSQLSHPNVLKFVGTSSSPPCYLVTEYLPGGDLRSFLQKQTSALNIETVVAVALDIARGVEYLHSKNIIHRDLKPENIVCSATGNWTVIDFGISRTEGQPQDMTAEMGTCRWMAPEVIMGKQYDRNVDVYSFGLLMWQLLSREVPFKDMTTIQVAFAVANKSLRPTIPESCPHDLSTLIQARWHQNPSRRPTFSMVVKELESLMAKNFPKDTKKERRLSSINLWLLKTLRLKANTKRIATQ